MIVIIVGCVLLGFAAGTTLALLLVGGAKQLRDQAPPILRATPRPTDWTRQERNIAS